MSNDDEERKQLATYVGRLTDPIIGEGTRADLSTEGDYSRRPLAGLLHNEIRAFRRTGQEVDEWHVDVGLRDEPSTGKQPILQLDLAAGTVWLTGEPKSGKSHALRCVLDDWTRRYQDTVVIHLNGEAASRSNSNGLSPVYFGSDDLNAQALVIRQIWARHFQRVGPFPIMLAIERADLLLRALGGDERTLENLLDLLRDGVTRRVFCCVTAVQPREALLVGGAREVALVRRQDSPLPYAQPQRGSWAMFYTEPEALKECGPVGACNTFGIPSAYTLMYLSRRLGQESLEFHVPIGIDWQTHEVVWVGGSSLAISGDNGSQDRLMRLGQMFVVQGQRRVVQLKSPRDPDYVLAAAANGLLERPDWTKDRIIQIAEESFGGVLLVPNIDTKADTLSEFSGSVANVLANQGWIVVASANTAGTALFENATAKTRFLSNYSQCLWLQTMDRTVSTHGGPDRFPVWPSQVREDLGDAFLLRTDGYAQTIRMPTSA